MSCLLRMFPLLAAAAGTIGQPQPDRVILQNTSGNENGLLVWGLGSEQTPSVFKSSGGTILVGDVRQSGQTNQAAAFTLGRPPAMLSSVDWDDTTPKTLAFPNLYELRVKIWVLCANRQCTGELTGARRANLAAFLVWANTRLEAERTGVALVRAGDDWISDQTASPLREEFGRFLTGGAGNDCNKVDRLTSRLKEPNAFNIYVVGTVKGRADRGQSCLLPDFAVVGSAAIWGTILHEIGHNLSLLHTDGEEGFGGQRNLMHSASGRRRFLTEGQVFRMHFSMESALNKQVFPRLGSPLARDCHDPSPAAPCPEEVMRLWPDP